MSHTTYVKSVAIKNIEVLTQTVKTLNDMGVKCSLEQDAQPRMYYSNQHGKCPYTLRLHNSPYDVGFVKNTVKGEDVYMPVLDTWHGYVKAQIGAKGKATEKTDEAVEAIGLLTSLYSANLSMHEAKMAGAMITGYTADPVTGEIQVEIETLS